MSQLIFDIETIGDNFDEMDATSKHMLTRWIEKTAQSKEEYNAGLANLKNELGFSPLTGQIVAIGVLDGTTNKGRVYFQAPNVIPADPDLIGRTAGIHEENGIQFKIATEKEMLQKFWELATTYTEFVSFNGRGFDAPFLVIRSAIHRIKPTKDLLTNRYLKLQPYDAKHIDLMDQLSFYGTFRPKGGNLHMFTRAFGIESPKVDGIDGDDVATLFSQKKFLEIARYNARDIIATKKLYDIWNTYIR